MCPSKGLPRPSAPSPNRSWINPWLRSLLGAVLGQIFGLARRFQVEVQPQFNLLQKTMVMAEGVGRQLNPEANMWPIARELAEDWAKDQQGLARRYQALLTKC